MFDRIVSKLSNIVRTTVRAIGNATRKAPWVTAILLFFLFV